MRHGIPTLVAVCALAVPAIAGAGGVAIVIEGPDASEARADVVRAVPQDLTIVPEEELSLALEAAGQRKAMGDAISNRKKRGSLEDRLREAGQTVGADAVIAAQVRKLKKKKVELHLLVVDVRNGAALLDRAVPLSATKKGIRRRSRPARAQDVERIRDVLVPALDQAFASPPPAVAAVEPEAASLPPVPAREAEAPAPREEREADVVASADVELDADGDAGVEARVERDDDDERYGRELLELGAGLEIAGRNFAYTDPITANLRPYEVFGVPMLTVSGTLFPLDGTDLTVLRDLGLTGGYGRALGLESQVADGPTLTTTWDRFSAGLRGRIRTGDGNPVIGLTAGVGGAGFHFEGGDGLADELPDVAYLYRRTSIDARFPGESVSVTVGLGYLGVLSGGEVEARFPRSTAGGVEASFGGAYAISPGLEARLALGYTRFFYTMNPEPGDTHIAGGALDEFVGVQLGAAYVY